MFLKFFFFFLLMENLGAMAYSRYTGFREIMDRGVLELHCNRRRSSENHCCCTWPERSYENYSALMLSDFL